MRNGPVKATRESLPGVPRHTANLSPRLCIVVTLPSVGYPSVQRLRLSPVPTIVGSLLVLDLLRRILF